MKAVEMCSMRPQVMRRPERRRERDLPKVRRDTIKVIEEIFVSDEDPVWHRFFIRRTNIPLQVVYPGMRP